MPRRQATYGPKSDFEVSAGAAASTESYQDDVRYWYASGVLPLYGLPPEWLGQRSVDYFGLSWPSADRAPSTVTSDDNLSARLDRVALIHHDDGGGFLKVSSYRRSATARFINAIALDGLRRRATATISSEENWEYIQTFVDGKAVEFQFMENATEWVSLAPMDKIYLMLEASHMSPQNLRLEQIQDLTPYLAEFASE